jgi:hypothetical protein
MRLSRRDEHMAPWRYEAARVELFCPVSTTHVRSRILAHAMIYADGWARWPEDRHIYVGDVQAGPGCNSRRLS